MTTPAAKQRSIVDVEVADVMIRIRRSTRRRLNERRIFRLETQDEIINRALDALDVSQKRASAKAG